MSIQPKGLISLRVHSSNIQIICRDVDVKHSGFGTFFEGRVNEFFTYMTQISRLSGLVYGRHLHPDMAKCSNTP